MKRFLNIFFNLKLRSKLFISFLIIIFMSTIMVNYYIFKMYEADTINKSVALSQNLVEQLAANVAYKTKSLDDTIFLNVNIAEIFSNDAKSNDYLHAVRNSTVPALVDSISNSNVDIKEIFLETSSNETFYYNKKDPSDTEFKDKDIYKYIRDNYDIIKEKSGQPIWTTFKNDSGVIFIFRSVVDTSLLRYKGIIGIGIDEGYLKEQYSGFDQASDGSIIIYNGNQEIIYCNKDMLAFAEHFKSYLPKDSVNSLQYQEYNDSKYIITGSISNNSRWKVLYVIPSEGLLKDSTKIKFRIIIICLISATLAMIIALIISSSITSNIRLLLKKIKSVGQGDFSMQLEPTYHDEVGQLFCEFNVMSGKLNELIKKIAFEQVEKQKAEYNALLAQINPHFLYNALESINSFAKINGQEEIVKVIQSLSHLLRVSISGKNTVVKLRDEIDYVKNYLSIHRMILGDRIQVDYFIDVDVLDFEVPKLILQPIVENAIVHGIEGMRYGGLIVISAYKKDNLLIQVSDNGIGMGEENIKSLFDETNEAIEHKGNHTRLGIRSVNRRIKILYGDDYGLKISSESGIGTVVELEIPLKQGNGGINQ